MPAPLRAELVDALPKESEPPGYTHDMGKHTPMDKEAAARIQAAAAKAPDSASRQDDWDRRAQSAADRNEHERQDDEDV
ncbi:hypothetical protein [Streptosporangium roseum]|uniref:hypothetical protein n=1 Tax=Streptosporangium roseum TaxID=2001 RepID=UPI00332BA255